MRRYIFLILTLFIGKALFSQKNCDWSSLNDADKSYQSGNFDEAVKIINHCINDGYNEKQKVQGYRLLAKTFLALDNDSSANSSINEILLLNPKFQPDYLTDPPRFIQIINNIKKLRSSLIVTSVSKKEENIYETPATALLITDQQLKNRGYLDLEAMLHDLPGFDISRSNGNLYTHAYQRGYRSINTNRTLFLVDGVEENDLWSSNVYLSRQYAMSNIKNIEIVYGPASTMYGSNAFLGVINVITKEPQDMIKAGRMVGINVRGGYGSYNTKFIDGSFAVRSKNNNIALSVTGRAFFSDEQDLSSYPEHDYAPYTFENDAEHFHAVLDIKDQTKVDGFFANHPDPSNLYITNTDSSEIILTDAGIQQAMDYDNTIYANNSFKDMTKAYSFDAKLKIYDFLLGWSNWSKAEGTGSQYTDLIFLSSQQGGTWRPVHNYFYAKYDKDISSKLNISNFVRYKVHDFDYRNSVVVLPARYYLGNYNLNSLVAGAQPQWLNIYLFQKSNQLREEFKVLYQPLSRIDVVAGFEARFSSIQGNYNEVRSWNTGVGQDSIFPEEQAFPDTSILGGNYFFSRDLGFYVQSSIDLIKDTKISIGLRYDNNLVRQNEGYGNAFNPRFAIVYTPATFIIKGIYAEAFKDATNKEKYSTAVNKRELSNPTLEPEKVKNYEFVLGKSFLGNALMINASAYFSQYSNIIQEVKVSYNGGTTNQNQAVGRAEVYGINTMADYKNNDFSAYANYTYTEPYALNPTDEEGNVKTDADGNPYHKLRISDIATHQVNIGINYLFKDMLNLNLRTNIVGKRITGENTTVPSNPEEFNPYAILNGAITYSHNRSGLSIQLTAFNILNKEYSSPGLDYAVGDLASKLIQNKRNLHLSITYEF